MSEQNNKDLSHEGKHENETVFDANRDTDEILPLSDEIKREIISVTSFIEHQRKFISRLKDILRSIWTCLHQLFVPKQESTTKPKSDTPLRNKPMKNKRGQNK